MRPGPPGPRSAPLKVVSARPAPLWPKAASAEETFELFAGLSGDLTRALVRGSFGGRPVSLDVTHNEPAAVRIVGDFVGPLPLLVLMMGTVLHFL